MKKSSILFLIIVSCLSSSAFGQDTLRLFGHQKKEAASHRNNHTIDRNPSDIQTISGPGHNVGFYFGFQTEYSQIEGYDAIGVGGTFAMIANHSLAIGFSGKGFFTEPFEVSSGSNISYNYAGGYGGLLIEPIIFPKYPVHVSFPILLGAGGIAKSMLTNYGYPYEYAHVYVEDAEAYLIAEPGLDVEFNVTRWMRISLGCTYRITSSLQPSSFKSNPMNGFTGGLSMKFGKF